jgi:UDP-N-acetylglucosamine 2-epimerase (non-hydrolysing)
MTAVEATAPLSPKPLRILTVFGTRPEAIKMAPLVLGLAKHPDHFTSTVCVTAQHRGMLDQVLAVFGITPDIDLNLMSQGQDLFDITSRVLLAMRDVLRAEKPDLVLVHGDTTTTMATSLACFYLQIPVGHVEAGLRTYNGHNPFPEEMNRVLTDTVASLYFAPTQRAIDNLIRLGAKPNTLHLTGNTVIDALFYTLKQLDANPHLGQLPITLDATQPMVLVTAHRRENFGPPMDGICQALVTLCQQHPTLQLVFPVHPNPNVQASVAKQLQPFAQANPHRIHLIEPLDYLPFCRLMSQAMLILTDSGGVQEEAPSLSKPVLVLREETERPEAVDKGTVLLVGANPQRIVTEATKLLTDSSAYNAMAQQQNPYGDGQAVDRIIQILLQWKAGQA